MCRDVIANLTVTYLTDLRLWTMEKMEYMKKPVDRVEAGIWMDLTFIHLSQQCHTNHHYLTVESTGVSE